MVLYKVNSYLMYNYSCFHVDVYGFANLEKDIFNEKNCDKISNVINEWVRTYKKKAQIRSEEIALEASSNAFSVKKFLAICSSCQLPSFRAFVMVKLPLKDLHVFCQHTQATDNAFWQIFIQVYVKLSIF